MRVMVLIKATEQSEAGEMPSQELLEQMTAFNEELVRAGVMLAGEGLHPSSEGVRVEFSGSERRVIDGPFAETKELLAGYWLWQVRSTEEAIEWVVDGSRIRRASMAWLRSGRCSRPTISGRSSRPSCVSGRNGCAPRPKRARSLAMAGRDVTRTIEAVWRIESARLIAGIARLVRDVALAEDLAQEALVAALEQWPESGVPDNPGAWLMATAKHRGVDRLRRADVHRRKTDELGRDAELRSVADEEDIAATADDPFDDDLLRLIFTACHPVLSPDARVALTLRLLCGLTTREIARAYLGVGVGRGAAYGASEAHAVGCACPVRGAEPGRAARAAGLGARGRLSDLQ